MIFSQKKALFLSTALFFLTATATIAYADYTYTFETDTVGQTPSGVTVNSGTFTVSNDATSGNSNAMRSASTTGTPVLTFNNFSSASNYSVTWKDMYSNNTGRYGFVLRAQSGTTSSITGMQQGYIFRIDHEGTSTPNTVKIFKNGASASTQLTSVSLTSTTNRWFKAIVYDTDLKLYYSDNGTDFTLITSTSDNSYTTGGVQYASGFSGSTNGGRYNYIDNITQAYIEHQSAPVISNIAVSGTETTSATITWTTDEPATSQVVYGTTSAYGSSTTVDQTLKISHSVTLTGLATDTVYHFAVKSADELSNESTSNDGTFNTGTPVNGIAITTPDAYEVFQRNGSNQANITIIGTYTGTPTAIEASWNGGAYATIVASPTGGSFTGTLSNQTGGQGTLSVRFVNDTGTSASISDVGVGDVYVIAGQSNASGKGTNNQAYSHATLKATLFGNDDVWKNLVDPVDSNSGQIDSVSSDTGAGGSVWPLLATYILADQSVPVAFVPAPKGGTSITQWDQGLLTSTLYGSMYRRINAITGGIKAVLYFQGETDASNSMSTATYLSYLNALANNINSDFEVETVVGMIGNASYTATQLDNIRLAQIAGWNENSNIVPGPNVVDVNLADESGDNLHFKSNADLAVFAARWWAALKAAFYSGTDDGRGPRISSATYNTAKTEIILTFTDTSGLADSSVSPNVFTVEDNGVPVTVSTVTRLSSTQLKLTLASAASGTLTVTLASGVTGYSGAMPTDASTYAIPAEPFVDYATTLYDPDVTAPSISLTAPNDGTTVSGASVAVSATATDNIGVVGVQFKLNGSSIGDEDMNSPYSINWDSTLVADGSYTLTATARDAAGNTATTSAITVTVDNTAPTVSIDSDTVSLSAGTTSAELSLTTNESSICKYATVAGTAYGSMTDTLTTVNGLTHSTTLTGFMNGNTYRYYVRCIDDFGNTTTSDTSISFVVANPVPESEDPVSEQSPGVVYGSVAISQRLPSTDIKACTPATNFSPVTGAKCPKQTFSPTLFATNLRIGIKHPDVKRLQQYLNTHGFVVAGSGPGSVGKETTYFGPATRNAIVRLQKAYNIVPASGMFGPKTRAVIQNLF